MPAKKSSPVTEAAAPVKEVKEIKEVEKPVAQTAPATQATGGKATAKKDKKAETPSVAPDAVAKPVATETVDTPADKDEVSGGEVIIAGLLEKVSALALQIKTVQSSLKLLAKEFDKQKKIIDKVQKKREKAKKSPSGFAKPCKISDDLCDFIGVTKGSEQSRTDITRFINSYVKEHNLNNPQNRREFFPDKKLKAILNVKDGEKVTYFVLQRLIAHHFPPSMSKLAAAAKTA